MPAPDEFRLEPTEIRGSDVLEHELKSFEHHLLIADISPDHRARLRALRRHRGIRSARSKRRGKLAQPDPGVGNPTENIYGLLTTKVTFKEGRIVIDKR